MRSWEWRLYQDKEPAIKKNVTNELSRLTMATQAAPSVLSDDALELLITPDAGLDSLERLDLINLSEQRINPYQKQVVGTHHSDDMNYFCTICPCSYAGILHGLDYLGRCRGPQMDAKAEVFCLLQHLV